MKKRIKKLLPTLLVSFWFLSLSIVSVFLFTGCQKEPEQTKDNLITINVQTDGLIVKPITKNWSPDTWIFNYNPNQYVLTFTGQYHTYTFQKTIQELQQGFSITISPDTYIITYTTNHNTIPFNTPMANELDISINETKTIQNNSPLVLQGHNEDFLIVMDILETRNVQRLEGGMFFTYFNPLDPSILEYSYGYYNVEGDVNINYQIYVAGWENKNNTLTNCQKGNIYHIVSNINGSTSINIVPMNYNSVGW